MTLDPKLAAAEAEARQTRARLMTTVAELQAKIKPANVAQRAVERVKETGEGLARTGLETAQRRPWAAAAAGASLAFIFLRKPVRRLVDRATGGRKPRSVKKSHAKGSNDD